MEQSVESLRLGVDVGGTFTDLVLVNERTGRMHTLKVHSTPADPSEAVLTALARARAELGLEPGLVVQFSHGTTVASNTILERKGARTALLVTEGFPDILEIQRHKRYRLFDLSYQKTKPLVPRHLVAEIPERINARGEVLLPLDEAALECELRRLADEDIESLAICFLFSFVNDAHERRAEAMARDILRGCFVTRSSEVYPQYREYERTSTVVVNGYLGPRMSSHLDRMAREIRRASVRSDLYLMQSNGGIILAEQAQKFPVRVVESGPAAGVIGAEHFGSLVGRNNLITFDMGGTTAKAGLVEAGHVRIAAGQELGTGINMSRLLQGGGYYVGAPTVDIAEVGSGGGSIAWLDAGMLIKVGPQSAGADPGPVCYGLGGENPTVTDANLILGRLPSDYFLGGEMPVDIARARDAIRIKIAEPLGISVEEAAAAIVEVANASMLKMLRVVSVEKGHDPREFSLIAFGGGGPVHAVDLAAELGIREVLVPPAPGLLSAQGLLVADVRQDYRQTYVKTLSADVLAEATRLYEAMEAQGRKALAALDFADEEIVVERSAEMRYERQAFELEVPVPAGALGVDAMAAVSEAFHQLHERAYGHRNDEAAIRFVTLCVTAFGKVRPLVYESRGKGGVQDALTGERRVYFRDHGYVGCPIYARDRLGEGARLSGPAVIEAGDSTTVLAPGWELRCHSSGLLFLNDMGERTKA